MSQPLKHKVTDCVYRLTTTSVSITNSYLSLQHYKKSERKPLRNNTVAMEFISLCQRDFTAFNKICRHIDFTLRRHR